MDTLTDALSRCFALDDFTAEAQARLSAEAWAYFSGGAADEITLRANRAAWDQQQLLPRVLCDLEGLDPGVSLLGRRHRWPLMLAPVAFQRLAHEDGELATAAAAAALGTGLVLSSQASQPLEAVARAMGGDAALWFQLYWQTGPEGNRASGRAATLALVQRAEAAGYQALVLTVDAPLSGVRDRERRAGFVLPAGVSAVNLAPAPAGDWRALLARAPTWAEVEWLCAHTRLPVLVKGVLHPEDAREALRCGARGLVVSNHGGRVLDTVPATAALLPRLRDALQHATGPGMPCLLVDGGIRRGTDVLKALALGADAVLLGRPQVYALAAHGPHGVARCLALLHDEFIAAMALCGVRSVDEIGPALLG
ncbi:alpha-hydroxy acid oxidase [Roseateles paludis]|uniref:Alpha-hydroxy acid oxidase n=1 Tax=Roseateles paludis TaxID=3145238 RepID=A0ABV0FY51_9BURK